MPSTTLSVAFICCNLEGVQGAHLVALCWLLIKLKCALRGAGHELGQGTSGVVTCGVVQREAPRRLQPCPVLSDVY